MIKMHKMVSYRDHTVCIFSIIFVQCKVVFLSKAVPSQTRYAATLRSFEHVTLTLTPMTFRFEHNLDILKKYLRILKIRLRLSKAKTGLH